MNEELTELGKVISNHKDNNFHEDFILNSLSDFSEEMINYTHTVIVTSKVSPKYFLELYNCYIQIRIYNKYVDFKGLDIDKYNRKIQQMKSSANKLKDIIESDIELSFPEHPSSLYYTFSYLLDEDCRDSYLSIIEDVFGVKATRGNKYTEKDKIYHDSIKALQDSYSESKSDEILHKLLDETKKQLAYTVEAIRPYRNLSH